MPFLHQLLLSLSLAASFLTTATDATLFSNSEIIDQISVLQNSESYLSADALDNTDSYQFQAALITAETLANDDSVELKHILNFYVLSCIYYATNGVGNTETNFPGSWIEEENWLSTSDYCSWWGITCYQEDAVECDVDDGDSLFVTTTSDTDDRVLGICLAFNNVSGVWPAETGLLGGYLALLAVDENEYAMAVEPYDWFASLSGLKQLYAGSSSWDAHGIPTTLNQLSQLEYFSVPYTYWSEGPIRGEAFAGLDNLKYVDMSDNLYDWMGDERSTLPDALVELPQLQSFLLNNVIFHNDDREEYFVTLSFLERMTGGVVKVWLDNTRLSGTIPPLPVTLKSFSLLGSGVLGNLNEFKEGQARLTELWLAGNQFEGTIPLNMAARMDCSVTAPCWLHLEGNPELEGSMPPGLCTRYLANENKQDQFVSLGGDAAQCDGSCCTCVGLECGNFEEFPVFAPPPPPSTSSPAPAPGLPPGQLCFSGATLVETKDRGLLRMDQLQLGDLVLTDAETYEPIYSFGHYDINAVNKAEFLQISTEQSLGSLELTPNHFVFKEGNQAVPASSLSVGDKVVMASGDSDAIVSIRTVTRKGVFAPYTYSGTIITNGIKSSSFATVQDNARYVTLGTNGIQVPITYHQLGLIFESPHRLYCRLLWLVVGRTTTTTTTTTESYNNEGMSVWVEQPLQWYEWLIMQQSLVVSGTLLLLVVGLWCVVNVFEMMMLWHPAGLVAWVVLVIVACRRRNCCSKRAT
eukprot:CAMPEP_0178916908 /NCGR_PEP_ID=MMETSP0786-20121207/12928_1 /TAXON_ID=186022 /ORGANISM="Thalassionema frauenfeldii, Strain CCMP 1798" /LENGTH=749 /DNA_ID=CAMNT_0020590351 /DNA_START=133 /DNA_END=2378 /DNA_ORIENTATION=-